MFNEAIKNKLLKGSEQEIRELMLSLSDPNSIHYKAAHDFLTIKHAENLVKETNSLVKETGKLVNKTLWVSIGTWFLVIATWALVFVTIFYHVPAVKG